MAFEETQRNGASENRRQYKAISMAAESGISGGEKRAFGGHHFAKACARSTEAKWRK